MTRQWRRVGWCSRGHGVHQARAGLPRRCVAALLLGLFLSACAAGRGVPPVAGSVVSGSAVLSAQVQALSGRAALDQDQAVASARRYVPRWSLASATSAAYVALTLRNQAGKVVDDAEGRPVWLVTFQGVPYAPASGMGDDCVCQQATAPPTTVVALDARTGDLVASLGLIP